MALRRAMCLLIMLLACSTSDPGAGNPDRNQDPSTQPPGMESPDGGGAPRIRLVGRFDMGDSSGARVGWPGARVVVRFTGSEASARLLEKVGNFGPSRYDVLIDGNALDAPLVPNAGTGDYVLARGLGAGPHVLEIYRRTEGSVGTTQIKAFNFIGGKMLAPDTAPTRRIEFLGDSETNGYGIEGNGPDCTFSGATQNERKAYPAIVARDLGADHVTVSASGKGVLRNADKSDPVVFGALYERALPLEPASKWDFASFVPDVVVIALGGNDWERPDPDVFNPPDVAALQEKYADLVEKIRGHYPSSRIFCTLPASLTDEHPEGYDAYGKMKQVLEEIVQARSAAGDARVHLFEFPRATDSDRTGCDYHYGPAFHRRMADALTAAIRARTGW